ncbi:MAG TPA: glycosyltransferase family 39 protein, partial [Chitinophagaceae bacterium]
MNKKTIILTCFIILKFLLQYLLVNPEYDLQRDEYLYLDQANHLAWGYASVPPVTSWISSIILYLGNTLFWVRFFPALFGALTIVVVWKAIEELKGNLFALILGASCILFSCLLRLNLLYQPNSLDVLCWTSFYYILIRYFNTEKSNLFFIGAIIFAIGFLNKYNFVFLLFGLVPALLITEHYKIFTSRIFYTAVLLALLLILPNLLWQYNNHLPVYHHLKELADRQLVNINRWNFLKEQLFYFIGSFFVILSALYSLLFYPSFKKYKTFFWVLVFTLVIFVYLRAKGYYAIGLYPIYIAFGSVYLEHILKIGWKRYLQPIAIAIPILFYLLFINVFFSIKSPDYIMKNQRAYKNLGLLRWEDGKDHSLPQDFADMLGWKELANRVDSIYSNFPNQDQTLILCDNYGQAGAINYYAKNIKNAAVSFNADYINWFNLNKRYDNLIRVKSENKENELKISSPFFDSARIGGSVTNNFAREY